MDLVIWYRSGKKNAGADAVSHSPMDWDDNGHSSLLEKQDNDNDNDICDWASENGPSRHTKFDHIFHICCIITNELQMLCK